MTQLFLSISIGTAATVLAMLLLLLRFKFQGRKPLLAFTQSWLAASTRTCGLALLVLSAVAAYCFARIPAYERGETSRILAFSEYPSTPSTHGKVSDAEENSSEPQALAALRAYSDKIDTDRQTTSDMPAASEATTLPDVDAMLSKLVARLEKQPDDVKGWKMLGWSYFNLEKPADAVRAYETALKLAPGDREIEKRLEQAKAAQSAVTGSPPGNAEALPAAGIGDASGSPRKSE